MSSEADKRIIILAMCIFIALFIIAFYNAIFVGPVLNDFCLEMGYTIHNPNSCIKYKVYSEDSNYEVTERCERDFERDSIGVFYWTNNQSCSFFKREYVKVLAKGDALE